MESDILTVPCEFRKAFNVNGIHVGYWVRVFFLIIPENNYECHLFLHRSELSDNTELLQELGIAYVIDGKDVFVSSSNAFKGLYKDIVTYVSQSGFDTESEL